MAAAFRAGYWCPIYYVVEAATTRGTARGRVQRRHWPSHKEDCLRRRAHKVEASGKFVDMRGRAPLMWIRISGNCPCCRPPFRECCRFLLWLWHPAEEDACRSCEFQRRGSARRLLGAAAASKPCPARKLSNVKLLETAENLVGVLPELRAGVLGRRMQSMRRGVAAGSTLANISLLRRVLYGDASGRRVRCIQIQSWITWDAPRDY